MEKMISIQVNIFFGWSIGHSKVVFHQETGEHSKYRGGRAVIGVCQRCQTQVRISAGQKSIFKYINKQ